VAKPAPFRAKGSTSSGTPLTTKKNAGFSGVDILLLTVVFIWGGNFGVIKQAFEYAHPMVFATLRFAFATLIVFPLVYFREGGVRLGSRRDFLWCILLGVFSGLDQVLFMTGLKYTTSAKSAILFAVSPIFVTIISALRGDRMTLKIVAGILLSFAGVFVIIYPFGQGGSLTLDSGQLVGDLLVLAATLFWGLYVAYGPVVLGRHSSLKVTAYAFLWTTPVVALAGLNHIGDLATISTLPTGFWLPLTYSVLLAGVVSFVFWYQGVASIGPVKVMLYQYLVPVVASLLAYAVWGEPITWVQISGAVVVFAGIALARMERIARPTPSISRPGL